MTKAIIERDYAFITKPCLECGLRPTWDTLTIVWQGGVGDKLISEEDLNFFSQFMNNKLCLLTSD